MKSLFVVACLSLAACTSAVESSDPPSPGPAAPPVAAPVGPSAASGPSAPSLADRASNTGDTVFLGARNPAFSCRPGAFCEDFEEASWESRWSDAVATPGGRLELGSDSASPGKGSLRLYSDNEAATAFLLEAKADAAGNWFGAFSFAFRVDTIPGTYLGGPELLVKTNDGPVTIRVALKPEGLVLEQLAPDTCRRDRCTPSSKIIAPSKERHWYRVRIGFEVAPKSAAPYGRLEATVDGGELQTADLTVPFTDGSVFFRAGITQGDARPAFANLDDVSLLFK